MSWATSRSQDRTSWLAAGLFHQLRAGAPHGHRGPWYGTPSRAPYQFGPSLAPPCWSSRVVSQRETAGQTAKTLGLPCPSGQEPVSVHHCKMHKHTDERTNPKTFSGRMTPWICCPTISLARARAQQAVPLSGVIRSKLPKELLSDHEVVQSCSAAQCRRGEAMHPALELGTWTAGSGEREMTGPWRSRIYW